MAGIITHPRAGELKPDVPKHLTETTIVRRLLIGIALLFVGLIIALPVTLIDPGRWGNSVRYPSSPDISGAKRIRCAAYRYFV